MIELIFVIVIIGILAAVAIPKLSATRDDAKISTELNNLATCVNDAGGSYTATGTLLNDSAACTQLTCFVPTNNNNNLTVTDASSTESFCANAVLAATNKGLLATHVFAGTGVSY
jgi:general secretion pathway protein G